MARMVATKAALSIRLDALADDKTKEGFVPEEGASIGADSRIKLESRLRALEHGLGLSSMRSIAKAEGGHKQKAFSMQNSGAGYNAGADAPSPPGPSTVKLINEAAAAKKGVKRDAPDDDEDDEDEDKEKKKLSKEERKALKKAKKEAGDVSLAASTVADGDETKELSKEERRALKKAKKEAKKEEENGSTCE